MKKFKQKKTIILIAVVMLTVFGVADVRGGDIESDIITHLTMDTTDISGATISDTSAAPKYDGTILNSSGNPAGQIGQALTFDGINDNVTIPAFYLNDNVLTISAWIKCNASPPQWTSLVTSCQGSSFAGLAFTESSSTGPGYGRLGYFWNNAEGTWDWDSGLWVTAGQWAHVALVVEPAQATIYLNGVSATNYNSHGIEEFDSYTSIGCWDGGPGGLAPYLFFNGDIDDVAIWKRALRPAEINAIYQLGLTGSSFDGYATTPPQFASDPIIAADAIEDVNYAASIAHMASDPDGGTVTFARFDGPDWLNMASDGTISGTPHNYDIGDNQFLVLVTDDEGDVAQAQMTVTVLNRYSGKSGLIDFAGLAANWLDTGCIDTPLCDGADLTGDGLVDVADMHTFADNWLVKCAPDKNPFPQSTQFSGITFTGNHKEYTNADTWYPSWASDGHLYSPWTDGTVGSDSCSSNGSSLHNGNSSGGTITYTGQAKITGDDPMNLTVISLGTEVASAVPYEGRYPCGTLVYNGVWYHGSYCVDMIIGPWDTMGPFVGFRTSTDYGQTWQSCPLSGANPLFGESSKGASIVKFGSPHFVDFGRNMEHSPDGKAYMIGHGSTRLYADHSWVSGDKVYMTRVTPSLANINDTSKYEFFGGCDSQCNVIWTGDLVSARPLIEWEENCGCATMTYNAPLDKYFMCVTYGGTLGGGGITDFDTYILESDNITGPWSMVTYMAAFGPQAYFVNIPSKFISEDGMTMWLSYSANYSRQDEEGVPVGSGYQFCLQEITLQSP